jgi:hypothetical protein
MIATAKIQVGGQVKKLIMAFSFLIIMIWFYVGAMAAPTIYQSLPAVACSPAAQLYLVVWYEFCCGR